MQWITPFWDALGYGWIMKQRTCKSLPSFFQEPKHFNWKISEQQQTTEVTCGCVITKISCLVDVWHHYKSLYHSFVYYLFILKGLGLRPSFFCTELFCLLFLLFSFSVLIFCVTFCALLFNICAVFVTSLCSNFAWNFLYVSYFMSLHLYLCSISSSSLSLS